MNEEIAVRAYTVPPSRNTDYFKKLMQECARPESTIFDRVLVFDTETTVDLYQNLKFGYFQIYQYGNIEDNGLFYDSITVRPKELAELQRYSKRGIPIYTIEEFRKIFLDEVYDLETLCIGFNLP